MQVFDYLLPFGFFEVQVFDYLLSFGFFEVQMFDYLNSYHSYKFLNIPQQVHNLHV